MRRTLPLIAVAILIIGLAGVMAVSQPYQRGETIRGTEPPTVGEFVARYAHTLGHAEEACTPERALGILLAAGVIGDGIDMLDSPLTEEDVRRICDHMTLSLRSDASGSPLR